MRTLHNDTERRKLAARIEIEKAIFRAGGKQADLAALCGVTQKTVSIWLKEGYTSIRAAEQIIKKYPDLDGLLLVGFALEFTRKNAQ